jgi:beta-glucosidase
MVRFALLASIGLATLACSQKPQFPYQNPKLGVDKRTEDLLARMTPDEKREFLKTRGPIPRLAIPRLNILGAASSVDGVSLEATWNPSLAARLARLRPAAFWWRGDDPWLSSRMAVAWVSAVQEKGRIASMTEFPCEKDPRVLNEIELPPFRAAIEEAGLWSIGLGNCSGDLDLLQHGLGFRGFEFRPDLSSKDDAQIDAEAELPDAVPDDALRRVLRAMVAEGDFDPAPAKTDQPDKQIERIAAEQSIVLLKNEGGLLPLYATRLQSIAVEGSSEQVQAIQARAGTSKVVPGNVGDAAATADVDIIFVSGRHDVSPEPIMIRNRKSIVVFAGEPRFRGRTFSDVAAPALLEAWSGGKEAAQAATDVIFGDVNPSGKLPITLPKSPVNDHDGIYVGYRYFDQHNIDPMFPFGFGLSYTTFEWSDLRILPASPRYGQTVQVIVRVRNTGPRFGAETVELYIHQAKSSLDRPPKELKAFDRVELKPGESKDVALTLDRRSMSFYDPALKDWATEPGEFEVLLGASYRDIRLKGSFRLFP